MFYGRFCGIRKRKPGGVLNILLRACRCARVWFVRKRSGTVKIPAGWSGKYLWKDGILYRMTRKKSENTPRGREKMFVRTENSFRKMWIFPLKSPGKNTKMMKTGRKISFPAREKTWKLSRWQGKTCLKLGNGKRKKRIFLLKKFRRSIKNTGMRWKISQFRSGKGKKNYSDEAKKSQKTDDPDEKKQQIFRRRKEKCRKGCEAGQKNLPKHLKKYENTQTKREKIHFRKDGSFWKNRFFIKRIRRKRQTDGKETRES